jgi:hypothetical protein
VISPNGVSTVASSRPRVGNTTIKAVARAFRWRKLLETGVFATVKEIAVAEKTNASYVDRVLPLTLFSSDIIESILDGRQPAAMTLVALMGRLDRQAISCVEQAEFCLGSEVWRRCL